MRKRKPPEERKSATITIPMTEADCRLCERAARYQNSRSRTTWARDTLLRVAQAVALNAQQKAEDSSD